MKSSRVGAILVGCLLAGCGSAAEPSPPTGNSAASPQTVMYSGTTDQGLPVTIQKSANAAVVLAWRGSCSRGDRPDPYPHPLREAYFLLDGVPAAFSDRIREPGDEGSHERLFRSIELKRDGADITGHFRIRSRLYNGEDSVVTTLCDTGQVKFRLKDITLPDAQPLTVSRGDINKADFQEQITLALELVEQAVSRGDTVAFCAAMTARLRRTICRSRKAALELMSELGISLAEVPAARRVGRAAVVIVPSGSLQTIDGVDSRDVRTMRFVPPPSLAEGFWRLDHIGPSRQQPHPWP